MVVCLKARENLKVDELLHNFYGVVNRKRKSGAKIQNKNTKCNTYERKVVQLLQQSEKGHSHIRLYKL